jgi:ribosome-associated translation inhibitor RaiA
MTVPVDLIFRDVDQTPELSDAATRHIERIDRQFPNIQRLEVTISAPHKSHEKGQLISVHLEAHVPDSRNLVVSHEHHDKAAHTAGEIALRDAFKALQHQLSTWKDKRLGNVKRHG